MGIKVHQQAAFASAGGEPCETVLAAGEIVGGRYRVEGCLGAGGMGVVYEVRHLGLERSFALKLMRFPHLRAAGGRPFADRFRIEARALGRLRHPRIVEVTDYGVDPREGGMPYLVMEPLEGTTLEAVCAGGLPVARALPVLEAIAEAVDYAHDRGVLHRDLKPANVFLRGGAVEGEAVKVLDFGLARLAEVEELGIAETVASANAEGTEAGAFPGTPAYLAPEVARGEEATRAADIYAFGVLAYEVLAGRPPFAGAPAEVRRAQAEAPPPRPSALNPALPEELDAALLAPLAKEPGRRPRRAAEVVEALRAAAAGAERRQWRARELPRRLLLAALASPLLVGLAVLLAQWGPLADLERRAVDARFAAQPARPPDPRLLVVSIDEPTLAADAAPLAARGEEIGRALEGVFAAGAKGVAIDFLLPETWSRSPAFSRLVLRHPGALTLAAFSAPAGETVGTECVRGLTAVALGPARLSQLFGFVNLNEDADGVIRRVRLAFADREGRLRPAWAARAARSLAGREAPEEVWIDSAVDWRRLERISYQDLSRRLARDPGLVRGRLVLLGGDFIASGDDDHRVPRRAGSPRTVSGVVLQALLVDAILAQRPVREASFFPSLFVAGLSCMVLLAAALCLPRPGLAAGLFAGLSGACVLIAFAAFRGGRILLPLVVPLVALALSLVAGWAMRRALPGRILLSSLAALLCAAPLAAGPAAVAVVASLTGSASVAAPPGMAKRRARSFDWLPAGAVIEVGSGSAVVLAFADGRRWELKEKAKARLAAGELRPLSGVAAPLAPLPPMPRLVALAPAARAGTRSGAIRIRGERIRGLFPPAGSMVLAGDALALRFSPREDASRYAIEIEDPAGAVVFQAETSSPGIEVPAGILRAGARYRWRVRTLDRTGPALRGEGEFRTLTAEDEARRAALRKALEAEGGAGAPALLAAIDRRCGLAVPERGEAEPRPEPRQEAAQGSATEPDEARAAAIAAAEQSGTPEIAAQLLQEWGESLRQRNDWTRAEDCFRRALAIREKLAPESLEAAASLNALGGAVARRGDPEAEDLFRRALSLRERLAPDSLDLAASLNNLGNLLADHGDWAAAEALYRRALTITERLAPGSLHVARNLNNLGIAAADRGDLAVAEDYHRRALAIREKLTPDGLLVAASLNNLGAVAVRRGDLAAAAELYRRALAIGEKLAPESLDVAWALNNLGVVAYERRDLATAEALQRRALAIKEKLAPGTSEVAGSLSNLGNIAAERRDLAAAEDLYRRALALDEKLEPQGLDLSSTLTNLGAVALDRGDLAAAADFYLRALAIREKLIPASSDEAESLYGLGAVYRRMGRAEQALDAWRRAIAALESQNARLGGTEEARSAFAAKHADYYRQTIDLLLELRRPEEALHVLERSRARSLLALLAERDLAFGSDLPPEIAGERRRNAREYDRVQDALGGLRPDRDGAEIERLLGRLRELRAEREEIAARVREASPRFASLQYPQPLDLTGVRRSLDPGTVLLAYSVGAERTVLLVVQPSGSGEPGIAAFTIAAGRDELARRIEALRRLIERRDAADLPALATVTGELYRLLVLPAEPVIAPARRLLISPDGPLHFLPFAVLSRGDGRPLMAWKPLHAVVSATVYAELIRSRRRGGDPPPVTLTAFGDPRYPPLAAERTEPELRSVLRRGVELEPLPATRREVEGIAGLFPRAAATYLGEEATEERAKSLGRGVRYLHFACHGVLDERFPLNSALALTIPESPGEGRDNGLLQAWEIFEQVRVDADLVTLSACDTALGQEMGGEGLVGLARAFQYAGARSVLASLWGVSDESTAELMRRFYGHLKAGKTKDEALRAAQLEVMRMPGPAHPFHWGAFVVIGDWR